jgi:hypothetical protein
MRTANPDDVHGAGKGRRKDWSIQQVGTVRLVSHLQPIRNPFERHRRFPPQAPCAGSPDA